MLLLTYKSSYNFFASCTTPIAVGNFFTFHNIYYGKQTCSKKFSSKFGEKFHYNVPIVFLNTGNTNSVKKGALSLVLQKPV